MGIQRHVRIFRNGRNRAVRIPREFDFLGDEAVMRREGEMLIIEPAPAKSLLQVLAGLDPIAEVFPAIDDLPPDDVAL